MQVLAVTPRADVLEDVRTALLGDDEDSAVEVVAAPRAALQWLDDEPGRFDVVVADADTTPTGGFALARDMKARAHLATPMPPVVLLIARLQDRWLAEWAEADAWSLKPVDPFDLAEVLAAVVDGERQPALPGVGYGGGAMREEARGIEREAAGGPAGGLTGGGP